jgi:hypothetical protein
MANPDQFDLYAFVERLAKEFDSAGEAQASKRLR